MKKIASRVLSTSQWKENLKSKGFRVTIHRLSILELLAQESQPVSAEWIYDQLKVQSQKAVLDLTTIYRNLKQLTEKNLVEKSFFEKGRAQYALVSHQEHQHHIQCLRCDKMETISVCVPKTHIQQIAGLGYQQISHRLEFFGICQKCS